MLNPLLLSDWLPLCERARVPSVPATFGPAVQLDEIQRVVEGLGKVPTVDAARAWIAAHCRPPATMWRWDCCAGADLKEKMAEGHEGGAPRIDVDFDDERLLAVLELLERGGAESVRVLTRPWVEGRREGGRAVELRAFVSPGGVAISSYHAGVRLPSRYRTVALSARTLAERLADIAGLPAFTADFLLTAEDTLVFLEGGPGFDRSGLVDPCCFDPAPVPGEIRLGPAGGDEDEAAEDEGAKVGIFWLYGKRLIVFGEEAAGVPEVAGVRDSRYGHDEEWARVQAMHPELEAREYFEIPRGRVLHRPAEGVFDVFLPAALGRVPRVVAAIARAFHLPADAIRVRRDEHYELPAPGRR